jgi:hypothetical protein
MVIAPLRHAVLHLGSTGLPFTPEAVAAIGSSSLNQAKGWLSRLAKRQVVTRLDGGRVAPGKNFLRWVDERPRTKPGGNRIIRYRAVSKV